MDIDPPLELNVIPFICRAPSIITYGLTNSAVCLQPSYAWEFLESAVTWTTLASIGQQLTSIKPVQYFAGTNLTATELASHLGVFVSFHSLISAYADKTIVSSGEAMKIFCIKGNVRGGGAYEM